VQVEIVYASLMGGDQMVDSRPGGVKAGFVEAGSGGESRALSCFGKAKRCPIPFISFFTRTGSLLSHFRWQASLDRSFP
jgi:hypothetical protein